MPILATDSFLSLDDYVSECTSAGVWVPKRIQCENLEELPVWKTIKTGKSSTRVRITLQNFSKQIREANTSCDAPALVQQGNPITECLPTSRIGILQETNKSSFCIALCRKHDPFSPADQYQDVSLVCYNKVSGATCFFGTKAAYYHPSEPADRFSHSAKGFSGPGDKTRNTAWMQPQELDQVSRCVSCHDNDPFVISPNLGTFGQALRFKTKTSPFDPYSIVGSKPPFNLPAWKQRFVLDEENRCTKCHDMGKGSLGGCGYLNENSLGQRTSAFHSATARTAWMPKDAPGSISYSDPDLKRLQSCCEDAVPSSEKKCRWIDKGSGR